MKNKKLTLTIIGVVALVLITIGLSYAYWLITQTQTNQNLITSACLDISLTNEKNDIHLQQQYPISDEEGLNLTPYEFTVTNNCNVALDYQIALEATGDQSKALLPSSLKVALDDNASLLSSKTTTTTTVDGAYASYVLGYGTLGAKNANNASASHTLKLWIDANAPIEERNKTFTSKVTVTVGQGIEAPVIVPGTIAYDILQQHGGESAITEFTGDFGVAPVEGEGGLYKAQDDLGESYYFRGDVENNYVEFGTKNNIQKTVPVYSFDYHYSEEGEGDGAYETQDECETSPEYDFYLSGSDYESVECVELSESFFKVFYTQKVFGDWASGHDAFTSLEECQNVSEERYSGNECYIYDVIEVAGDFPMYWRIIRINGDGTIRMIYDGTEKVENGISHAANIGATMYNDGFKALHVGYTYNDGVTETDSTIKDYIDAWYEANLKNDYGTYIADSIFCNDREVTEGYCIRGDEAGDIVISDGVWDLVNNDEMGNCNYYELSFAPYTRLITNKSPKLTCTRGEDKYTINENKVIGNGLLSNPVGLITADEVMMAGATTGYTSNPKDYLYIGDYYWTATSNFSNFDSGPNVWNAYANLGTEFVYSNIGIGVRPVINLRSDVAFTGNGSYETPYVITTY